MKKSKIASVEVGSGGANSIEFTSIPQIYTDLLVVFSVRAVSGTFPSSSISLNSYGTGSYSRIGFKGSGTTASNDTATETEFYLSQMPGSGNTANSFTNAEVYISNYAVTTLKTLRSNLISEQDDTQAYQALNSGAWNQTSPITSLSIGTYGRTINLAQYSSATLYGITAGSDGTTTVS
jgi:hypothetical protein